MSNQNYDMNDEEIEHVQMFDKLVKENDYPALSYCVGIDKNNNRHLIITFIYNDDIIALGKVFDPESKEAKELSFQFNESEKESKFTYEEPRKWWYQFWRHS